MGKDATANSLGDYRGEKLRKKSENPVDRENKPWYPLSSRKFPTEA